MVWIGSRRRRTGIPSHTSHLSVCSTLFPVGCGQGTCARSSSFGVEFGCLCLGPWGGCGEVVRAKKCSAVLSNMQCACKREAGRLCSVGLCSAPHHFPIDSRLDHVTHVGQWDQNCPWLSLYKCSHSRPFSPPESKAHLSQLSSASPVDFHLNEAT